MRIRNVLAVLGAAVLMVGAGAPAASAGTGASRWCGDSTRWISSVNVSDPVTAGVEIVKDPTSGHIWVHVCLSDARAGEPGITGGALSIEVWPKTTLGDIGFDYLVKCLPDAVFCTAATSGGLHINIADIHASPYLNNECVLGCLTTVPVPGATVDLDVNGTPLLTVSAAGVTIPVDSPLGNCIRIPTGVC